MAKEQIYTRFSLAQRIEHIILLVSFSTLAITGIPQKYASSPISETVIAILGGITTVRILHHAAAVIFTLQAVYHAFVLGYKVFVRHSEMSMLPGLKDVTDAINAVRYNLGLARRRPMMPRYSFDEKVEYWAMIWGTVIMALTGFILWNPITFSRLLPGEFIPAAKAAHGGEAVLAVLAILIWHFYHVHIKFLNRSIFTGMMTRHQMEEEHGEELARLERGLLRPQPNPAVIQRRRRAYLPVAVPAALALVGGVYWFATFESTAVATVPTPTPVPVFVPLPTDEPTAVVQVGAAIPHSVEGREQCDTCHGLNGTIPYPANHAERPNESCQACHKPGAAASASTSGASGGSQPSGVAKSIPHPVEGREDCAMCHSPGGLRPVPADHQGRSNDTCTACHQLAPAISGTPAAKPSGESGGTAANPIPHPVEGREQCETCHGSSAVMPYPADHEGRDNSTCVGCHTTATDSATASPAAGTAPSSGPSPVPHSTSENMYKDCTTCHGVDKAKPFPANHASFAVETCTSCHQSGASNGQSTAAGTGTGAPTVSHSTESEMFKDCTACHGPDKISPAPADHANFTTDTCKSCHQPTY